MFLDVSSHVCQGFVFRNQLRTSEKNQSQIAMAIAYSSKFFQHPKGTAKLAIFSTGMHGPCMGRGLPINLTHSQMMGFKRMKFQTLLRFYCHRMSFGHYRQQTSIISWVLSFTGMSCACYNKNIKKPLRCELSSQVFFVSFPNKTSLQTLLWIFRIQHFSFHRNNDIAMPCHFDWPSYPQLLWAPPMHVLKHVHQHQIKYLRGKSKAIDHSWAKICVTVSPQKCWIKH